MVQLTEQQIEHVRECLEKKGITYAPLADELLDHLCCLTEVEMESGSSFHEALQVAFAGFHNEELPKIQKQIIYSTTQKKRIMKVISLITLGIMLTFSTIHWGIYQEPPSISPLNGQYEVSSHFGMRHHPLLNTEKMHKGIDFKAPLGTPVVATADGVVIKAEHFKSGYGKHIIIRHDDQFQTLYAQLSAMEVKEGDEVKKGQAIGAVGNSGTSTGSHLHYEVIKEGMQQDPAHYFYP